ncbi:MAG: prolipoprotein diacylglyceryl transferase family protein [Pseudomonadota bacterium]
MSNLLFIATAATLIGAMLAWSFRHLTRERWQFVGAIPTRKCADGAFDGVNLTYYGLLNANAYVLATAVAVIALGAMGIPLAVSAAILAAMLGCCMPAARIIARIVEKKRFTFSVGGAAFVGILIVPWIALAAGRMSKAEVDPLGVMAAVAIAYAFGEGAGRLACISFGCCYGRPVASLPGPLKGIFRRFHFVFRGETKKCAYASRLDGTPVVPVQAITAVLYCAAGVISLALLLNGYPRTAMILSLVITQLWRFFSEFLRSDYRGDRKISAYQIMGLAGIAYGLAVAALMPPQTMPRPDITAGLAQLWAPGPILMLQLLWIGAFLYTGRSQVTGASIRFFVHQDRI